MTAKGDTVKFNMLYVIRVFPYTYIYIFKHIYCMYIHWAGSILYQKFEIGKYTVCGRLILPKKMERHF